MFELSSKEFIIIASISIIIAFIAFLIGRIDLREKLKKKHADELAEAIQKMAGFRTVDSPKIEEFKREIHYFKGEIECLARIPETRKMNSLAKQIGLELMEQGFITHETQRHEDDRMQRIVAEIEVLKPLENYN